jgi:hypothetical protein
VGESISRQQLGSPDESSDLGVASQQPIAIDAGEREGADSVIGTRAAPSSVSSISIVCCSKSSERTGSALKADVLNLSELAAKECAS